MIVVMIELPFKNKFEDLKGTTGLNISYFPDFLSKGKSDILYKKFLDNQLKVKKTQKRHAVHMLGH